MKNNNGNNGYLELIIFSILSGTVGVFVKLSHNLDVYTIIFFRAIIAALFILLVVIIQKKLSELSIVSPYKTILVAVLQGLSFLCYFAAIIKTSVTNAVFLLYTAPVFTIILARIFLKEKIQKKTIIGLLITLAGIIFILDPRTFSFSSAETVGNILGLAGGFFYASMTITAKSVMKKTSGYYMAFWQYLIISILFVFFLKKQPASNILINWWILLIIGIVCTGIAFLFFMSGVKKTKAQEIFIITALEPLSGTTFAIIILREMPTIMIIIGAALILFGVYRTMQYKN